MQILSFIWVGAGGAIGACMRYGLSLVLHGSRFPLATLCVNLLGCALAGALLALFERGSIGATGKLFLMTGILGGFTTFSAYSVETLQLVREGQSLHALSYALISVCGCVIAAAAGFYAMRVAA
jgi:fluoride exporter